MRFALLAFTATALLAQSPEIRGRVIEEASGAGLLGVEVTLTVSPGPTARVVGSTFTDAAGEFVFKPEAFGKYQVDAKKSGYSLSSRGLFGAFATFLSADYPRWEPRLAMMIPGVVSGRLVDEQDAPLAGFRVFLSDERPTGIAHSGAVTRADGTFNVMDVSPGNYEVLFTPESPQRSKLEEYSDEAFERIDRDWDLSERIPFVAPSGASTLGTIRLRQTDLHRVRVNIQGDCSGDAWTLALLNPSPYGTTQANISSFRAPCKQQLLLTNVPAGSYQVALWADGDNIRWALAPLLITRSNTSVNLSIASATDVPGRITTSEGVPRPPVTGTNFLLMMRPDAPGISNTDAQEPQVQADLSFVAHTLRWNHYRVSAPRVPVGYYVREIRYNGRPVPDGRIDLLPQAPLEFELDNQPAHVSGTLTEGGKPVPGRAYVLLAKAPYDVPSFGEGNAPFSYLAASVDGRFDLTGLAPGEYRIASALDLRELPQRLQSGEKVTLEPGQQRTLELRSR